jgi:hypothetical protein
MKTGIILIALVFATTGLAFNQNLSDLYKKDAIHLQIQNDFAQNTNWNELFSDYNSHNNFGNSGMRKKIIIAPDGSVFMSQKSQYDILKFDSEGNLVKKFGGHGGKAEQFLYFPSVEGVLDGKYLIVDDFQGRLCIFDLNGKFIKLFRLEYMPEAVVPLKNGKIAILGYVPWKEEQSKYILRIKDFETGEEQEIWQEIESYNKYTLISIKFPKHGMMSCSLPYTDVMALRFRLASSKDGNLMVASPKSGEIKEFNPAGQLLNSFKLKNTPLKITEQDMNEQYEKAVKNEADFEQGIMHSTKSSWTDLQKRTMIEAYKKQLVNFKDPKYYPEQLPYFSSVVVDSEGNLLVFEFTKEEDKTSNKFRAYSYDMKGNFLGTSSFKSESLNLSFTSSTFQFYNGFVYVVANNKNSPPQIAKMKLQ